MSAIKPGDRVRCRDAYGNWHEWTAVTSAHTLHEYGYPCPLNFHRSHDFPVVVVDTGSDPHRLMPWPADDVDLIP